MTSGPPQGSIFETISERIATVEQAIHRAAARAGRSSREISLIAVSKTQPAEAVVAAHAAGLTHFGENYLQDAIPKVQSLAHLPITWHFIGAIQSNKTRAIAAHFDWVHTVDRLKIAQRLDAQRPAARGPLNVCIQVNVDADPNKGGVAPDQVAELLAAVRDLPNLRVAGLMTILHPSTEPLTGYRLLAALNDRIGPLAVLSMGMSGDVAEAIEAGATFVRVGTAIFGPRRSINST